MAADEESENFFFGGEAGLFVPVRDVGEFVIVRFGVFLLEYAEEAMLTGFHVALGFLGTIHGTVEDGH